MPLHLWTPAEVACLFQSTESWVKEKARRREIPFTLIGGSYRFTEQHIAEIVRLFERRPEGRERHQATPRRRTASITSPDTPVATLQARRPRRARRSV